MVAATGSAAASSSTYRSQIWCTPCSEAMAGTLPGARAPPIRQLCAGRDEPEAVDHLTRGLGPVEGVEVQVRDAFRDQPLTHFGDHVDALGAERGRVAGERLEPVEQALRRGRAG